MTLVSLLSVGKYLLLSLSAQERTSRINWNRQLSLWEDFLLNYRYEQLSRKSLYIDDQYEL